MPRNQKELYIRSDTVNLAEVDEFIESVFIHYGLSLESFNKSLLCVKEAVTNSIMHGNKFDSSKNVNIKAYRCNKYLYFKIIDEGDGFDFTNLKDPTCMNTILDEGGRGLFIIKHLCDEVHFKEKGKVIELKISLDAKG